MSAPGGVARNVRMPVCALRARRSRRSGLREGPTEAGGRLPEAVALLRRAAAAPDGQDWFTTRPWLLAQLAGALAESGQHTEAVRILIEVRVAARRTPCYPLAEDRIALEEARIPGRSGDVPGALRRAEEVARRSAAAGRKATALAALHLLARLGRAAVAVELLDALGVAVRCPSTSCAHCTCGPWSAGMPRTSTTWPTGSPGSGGSPSQRSARVRRTS
ncbi:hypothetical protein ACWEQO_27580 [Streptomyces sp. NPDC004051]